MAAPANWLIDIWGWDKIMAVVTVFSVLASSAFIPVYHLASKRRQGKVELHEKATLQQIDFSLKPVYERITELEEVTKNVERDTRNIQASIADLSNEFHKHLERSEELYKKVYYMTGVLNKNRDKFDFIENDYYDIDP